MTIGGEVQIGCWSIDDESGAIETVREVYDRFEFTWDPAEYHADLYDVRNSYFAVGDQFLVARLNGQVVGTVAIEFFPFIEGAVGRLTRRAGQTRVCGSDCSLERLYVRPSHWKLGIGSLLMKAAVAETASRNCVGMEIWSDKRFTDAHRLYTRFGALVVGERICNDPDVSPEWGLHLALTSEETGVCASPPPS